MPHPGRTEHGPARPAEPFTDASPPRTLAGLNALGADLGSFVAGGARAVPGEGPMGAALALVGEQPGDVEDAQGRPFVGPAGHLLDRALAAAEIPREACYLTNAVKHFKFVQRGKRRIHQKPTAGEVSHYRWWLEAELDLVAPHLVVALGTTALLALTGKALTLARTRGPARLGHWDGFVTVHPASVLRTPREKRPQAFAALVADLRAARELSEAHH